MFYHVDLWVKNVRNEVRIEHILHFFCTNLFVKGLDLFFFPDFLYKIGSLGASINGITREKGTFRGAKRGLRVDFYQI